MNNQYEGIDLQEEIILFIIIGFIAQMIDGALGMAYGVTSNSFLLAIGISPAPASAAVHTSEIFTSGVSGFSHFHFRNIDMTIFRKLVITGVIGGIIGAYLLISLPADFIKPFVAIYLLITGISIILKARSKHNIKKDTTKLLPLGAIGGFFDAIGGGGWGPIVTSTLISKGNNPKHSIGTTNLAEFFVTIAQVATFIATIGLVHWNVIIGLIIGGVIAAPFAAYTCGKLPNRLIMVLVGFTILILCTRTLIKAIL